MFEIGSSNFMGEVIKNQHGFSSWKAPSFQMTKGLTSS